MRLIQWIDGNGQRRVGQSDLDERKARLLDGVSSVYELALKADRDRVSLAHLVQACLGEVWVDVDALVAEKRLLPPLDHPDPAHCLVTGTGLTHLGSAKARDAMHAKAAAGEALTDSMRLFQWGLEGGKPSAGQPGVQPEWFYKGNGYNVAAPEADLVSPAFALDGGEEAELVGLYVINPRGEPLRVGYALGNEFSDHVMEAQNYLYLAHSKLRPCSYGPELLLGEAPGNLAGRVRIVRDASILWEAPFLTGEDNMSYTLAGLEGHHFKYEFFRRPGDVHCHFFGAAVLSRNAGIATHPGDRFEIEAPGFGRPLRNTLSCAAQQPEVAVRVL
jgi:hypothetical protein